MGFNDAETLGISTCKMTDFYNDLRGQLSLVTGLVDLPPDLTIEDIRRPLLVIAPPGTGKTCGILSILNELNVKLPAEKQLKMKKILLGQTVVGELSGVDIFNPETGELVKKQSPSLPLESIDGKYGVLFLDVLSFSDEAQVQPALGLADDTRNIGVYTLPDHWIVVGAGNGPDCANFVKLDDMTLSRFAAYNINYNYKTDWRPWAHANNINPVIIAFLNWKPHYAVDVVSTDMDKAGKMFACPRTWTRLSTELRIRDVQGRPVSNDEMFKFASRIIGEKMAREFSAFAVFRNQIDYDAEKIVAGTERFPDSIIQEQAFHILIQSITSVLQVVIRDNTVSQGEFTEAAYIALANVINWILKLENFMLDFVINAFCELRNEVPSLMLILGDDDFIPYCPAWDTFLDDHLEALTEIDIDNIM